MSLDTVDAVVDWLLASGNLARDVTISWHAGEPFVLAADFYASAFELFARLEASGHSIHHSIQTNATLVQEQHCAILRRYRSNVGVSLDGPKAIHDEFRVDRQGRGTFDKSIRGIEMLKAFGIPISAIAVVSRASLSDPDGFYNCFRQLEIPVVGINLPEIEGMNVDSYISDTKNEDQYRSFLQRLFTLSCSDGRVAIRELIHTLRAVFQSRVSQVSSEAETGRILSFSTDGRVGTFSPELLDQTNQRLGRMSYGPVEKLSFGEMLADADFDRLRREVISGVKKCQSECAYFSVCGGGAPSNKLGEFGRADVAQTHACRLGRQIVTDVVLELLEDRPALITEAWNTWWMRDYFGNTVPRHMAS